MTLSPAPHVASLFARRDPSRPPWLSLGTMNFGKRTPAAEAERIMARALELGIVCFDTANAYVDGESERIVGRFAKDHRAAIVLASKVGFGRQKGQLEGLSPEHVLAAANASLERLGTDYLDLYYLHVPDHSVPIDETLGAIKSLLDAGKIRAFGVSNYASWQILEIFEATAKLGMQRPAVAQQLYNLLIRQLDLEYARFAQKYGLHTTVYNPLAGGLLSGRYQAGDEVSRGSRFDKNRLYQGRYWSDVMLASAQRYQALAVEQGLSLVELSYAWLGQHPLVDSILVGPGSVAHLEAAHAAMAHSLAPDVVKKIDELATAQLGTETSYAR